MSTKSYKEKKSAFFHLERELFESSLPSKSAVMVWAQVREIFFHNYFIRPSARRQRKLRLSKFGIRYLTLAGAAWKVLIAVVMLPVSLKSLKGDVILFTDSMAENDHQSKQFNDILRGLSQRCGHRKHIFVSSVIKATSGVDSGVFNVKALYVLFALRFLTVFRALVEGYWLARTLEKFKPDLGLGSGAKWFIMKSYVKREIARSTYEFLFNKLSAKIIFYSSLSAPSGMLEVAHELGIVTVECQHGLLDFDFSFAGEPEISPDFCFCWTQGIANHLNSLGRKTRGISIGRADLVNHRTADSLVSENASGLLILSMGITSTERVFFQIIEAFRNHVSKFVFRPHPSERDNWQSLYPRLAKAIDEGTAFLSSFDSPVTADFKQCSIVIGTASAVLFEALLCQRVVYVLDIAEEPSMLDWFSPRYVNVEKVELIRNASPPSEILTLKKLRYLGNSSDLEPCYEAQCQLLNSILST